MKSFLILSVAVALFAGCQAASVNQAASDDTRAMELTGGQSRTTVAIPQSDRTVDAPYALSGHPASGAAMSDNYVSHGTINGF